MYELMELAGTPALIIVASIYKPFSVKTFNGAYECFSDLNWSKFLTSSFFSFFVRVIIYPSGNFSGLFLTA